MKKKNFNSKLKLTKNVISNLSEIRGGISADAELPSSVHPDDDNSHDTKVISCGKCFKDITIDPNCLLTKLRPINF